jgi:cytochrome c-type biogenesis protein
MVDGTATPVAAFLAGIVSVFSPCILPLIPAIVAYSTEKGKFRPIAIVLGLSISFTIMGIVTSAFGSVLRDYLWYLNILAELVITLLGLTMLFELNVFNAFGNLLPVRRSEKGLFGGLLLGMSLGVVWIPCVGPILAVILTKVAVEADITYGAVLLFIYSLGFAVPMLLIAYSASVSSTKLGRIAKYDALIKKAAGAVLVAMGLWMIYRNHLIRIL